MQVVHFDLRRAGICCLVENIGVVCGARRETVGIENDRAGVQFQTVFEVAPAGGEQIERGLAILLNSRVRGLKLGRHGGEQTRCGERGGCGAQKLAAANSGWSHDWRLLARVVVFASRQGSA